MTLKRKTEDLYIEMLRYGRENLADGVTSDGVYRHLGQLDPDAVILQSKDSLHNIFVETFQEMAGQPVDSSSDRRFTLRMDGYSHLLEHEELQEARKSSRTALRVAIFAIVISTFTTVVSILA